MFAMTFWTTALLCSLTVTVSGRSVDLTSQRDAKGADVVRSVLSRLDDSNVFDAPATPAAMQASELFMRESAYVGSMDGAQSVGSGGIWRISMEVLQETQQYNYPELFDSICDFFCIDWSNVTYDDLQSPLYSGLAFRIFLYNLYNRNLGLPDTTTDAERAIFWATYYGGDVVEWLTAVNELRTVEVCRVNTDVVFVLDSSGSIGLTDYQQIKDYTYNFTESLFSGDSDSRVGVILFSTSANVEIDFVGSNGSQALLERIRNLRYISEATNTPEGLCLLQSMQWRTSISVLRIAIVLTDGRVNRLSTTCNDSSSGELGSVNSTARGVHNLMPQVVVFAIGVANYVLDELNIIATTPDLVNELETFDSQLLAQSQISRTYLICFKETQLVTIGEERRGTARMGSTTRLQFSGPADQGVSVRICIDQGTVVVYGSYRHSNPSSALYDFRETLEAESDVMGDTCRSVYASLADVNRLSESCTLCGSGGRKKRQAEEQLTVTLYLTIGGLSEIESQFSVNSSFGDAFERSCNERLDISTGMCDSPEAPMSTSFIVAVALTAVVCALGILAIVVATIGYYIHGLKANKYGP